MLIDPESLDPIHPVARYAGTTAAGTAAGRAQGPSPQECRVPSSVLGIRMQIRPESVTAAKAIGESRPAPNRLITHRRMISRPLELLPSNLLRPLAAFEELIVLA